MAVHFGPNWRISRDVTPSDMTMTASVIGRYASPVVMLS